MLANQKLRIRLLRLKKLSQDATLQSLEKLVNDFTKSRDDVQGQIVMAYPAGVPIANSWQGEMNPILIGAISAAVKLTFMNLCRNLKKGDLDRILIHNENGKIIVQNAGPKAILTTIMSYDADIYTVAFMTLDITKKIEKLLENYKID